jgi:hypothetical protein
MSSHNDTYCYLVAARGLRSKRMVHIGKLAV